MNEEIKEGDIFRWRYKDEIPKDLGAWRRYHCRSQICIAKGGVLRDTYWMMNGSDETWSYQEASANLDLSYVGNFADLMESDEGKQELYDDADCVNLNHANSSRGNFYLRKGAERSRVKMLETAIYKKERAENDARFASETAERLVQIVERIKSGEDLNDIWI